MMVLIKSSREAKKMPRILLPRPKRKKGKGMAYIPTMWPSGICLATPTS